MTRRLWLFFLVAGLWLSPRLSLAGDTTAYDRHFRRWGAYYAPWQDWRWWKAQGMAESGLRPQAVSPCGAVGIMQLMPATAKAMGVKDAYDPEANIAGGIRMDAWLWRFWSCIPDAGERRNFMFAGYNAGPGSIQAARRKAGGASTWSAVARFLDAITGKHAAETITYVQRICLLYSQGY